MESQLVPILAAVTVALLVFVGVRIALAALDPQRTRLKGRLAAGGPLPGIGAGSNGNGNGNGRGVANKVEFDRLTAALVRFAPLAAVNARLSQACPEMPLALFVGFSAGCGFGGLLASLLVFGSSPFALLGAAAGFAVPLLAILNKRARRQRALADQLPEALDFLARVLKAGHSFSTGLHMMGEELPKPLSAEFRRAYDQHSLGQSLEGALKDMAARIQSTDFAFFVTAVLIQRQTGGDLAEVLGHISDMIRNRVRLHQHVKAKTAEGRLTGYVLVAFPLVMFLLLSAMSPKYAHTLTGTVMGHKLLAIAFTLQMLGTFAVRRITTIKV